jgi:hypothetical protein
MWREEGSETATTLNLASSRWIKLARLRGSVDFQVENSVND